MPRGLAPRERQASEHEVADEQQAALERPEVNDAHERRQLRSVLIEAGCAGVRPRARLEAVGIVAQHRPDLAFLDMGLAGGEAWTFAAELLTERVDLPLVVMSCAGTAHTAAANLGAVGYLGEPFTDGDVLREVGTLSRVPSRRGA